MDQPRRQQGRIKSCTQEWGYIAAPGIEEDIWFPLARFPGQPVVGERVSFVLRYNVRGQPQAHEIELMPATVPLSPLSVSGSNAAQRYTGTITQYDDERGFGFIASHGVDDKIFFHIKHCRQEPRIGARVSFELWSGRDGRPQAGDVVLMTTMSLTPPIDPLPKPSDRLAGGWAYLGYIPAALYELKSKALDEDWDFPTSTPDPEHPYPILYSYLLNTFSRLVKEKKVRVNADRTFAAFNTGLVDRLYEAIYAVFRPNPIRAGQWKLAGFCTAGERGLGQELMRKLDALPDRAHYFDDPSELIYDGNKDLFFNWDHVVLERLDRLPWDYLETRFPPGFTWHDPKVMSSVDRDAFFQSLSLAIRDDSPTFRNIKGDLDKALALTKKRVLWNFKTAIPQYYTKTHRLQLLLPLCIQSDQRVDVALAVERTESGYLGHTIFPLNWAYKAARLICRPDSDWLKPVPIIAGVDDAAEEEE